jgi:hypothetical protein
MTAKMGSAATAKVVQRITGANGQTSGSQGLSGALVLNGAQVLNAVQVRTQNVAAELAERAATVRYPVLQVYCEKIVNSMVEKFRTFSGTVQMAIEVRQSSDRLEGLEEGLEAAADAVTQILSASRGDWGDGMYYGGGYQVVFGAVKHGGKNFIQVAKVTFEIGASIN